MDTTKLDLVVDSGEDDSNRPWVTVAFDQATRQVMAVKISRNRPGQEIIQELIGETSEKYPDGQIHELEVDAGWTNCLDNATQNLNIELRTSKSSRADRAWIERFFKKLYQPLWSCLKGATPLKHSDHALLTISELNEILKNHIVNYNANKANPTTSEAVDNG